MPEGDVAVGTVSSALFGEMGSLDSKGGRLPHPSTRILKRMVVSSDHLSAPPSKRRNGKNTYTGGTQSKQTKTQQAVPSWLGGKVPVPSWHGFGCWVAGSAVIQHLVPSRLGGRERQDPAGAAYGVGYDPARRALEGEKRACLGLCSSSLQAWRKASLVNRGHVWAI